MRFNKAAGFLKRLVSTLLMFLFAFLCTSATQSEAAGGGSVQDKTETHMKCCLSPTAEALQAPHISAESSILIEADSAAVLFEKNANNRMLIASTTKILTALVVIERCKIDETVKISSDFPVVEGSSVYLKPGDTRTVRELLYGLLLASGNDAAVALAMHTAGSIDSFASMMNERALEIGCQQSHFVNPHGLDAEGHYSSAYDLALITREAMKNSTFRAIVSTKYITIAGQTIKNHNKLLWNCPGVIGVKTGFTSSAGRSLVSCAQRNGMTLICVTLSAPNDWQDHTALYNWAFDSFRCIQINAATAPISSVSVISGQKDYAGITPSENLTYIFSANENVLLHWEVNKFAYAPVACGEQAGKAEISIDGKTIKTIPLIYHETVALDKKIPLNTMEKLLKQLVG